MYRCFNLWIACLLLITMPLCLFAQLPDKMLPAPARKLIDDRSIDYLDFKALRFHLHNAVEHYQYLNEANTTLSRRFKIQADSITQLKTQIQAQATQIQQLKQATRQYEKAGTGQKSLLDSVRQQIARLNYDRQLIADDLDHTFFDIHARTLPERVSFTFDPVSIRPAGSGWRSRCFPVSRPTFADFPADTPFVEAANFAGSVNLVTWGCGTQCLSQAMVKPLN